MSNSSSTEILNIIERRGINLNVNSNGSKNGKKQERINKIIRFSDLRALLSPEIRGLLDGTYINAQSKKGMNKKIIDIIDKFDETKNYFYNPNHNDAVAALERELQAADARAVRLAAAQGQGGKRKTHKRRHTKRRHTRRN